ncbi:FAD-dependent oxidoreductase [Virgibacillus sp. 179-BFC.A HS]|uniref:FAD-dependent oxidoreductase n=2 Tax=Tigheibacillus jepli TaxID=3035914 RepID=A0ABU5CJ94_9BACI|nr:FAD-dependent oxidoreductase [Virgibacillus sp. 179-BFC.A HS]MDY0406417.1 FAD-dependent oxidoreductase [Virgibacillus sp. 179-BFC.A HS]
MKKIGIHVHLGADVKSIEKSSNGLRVTAEQNGKNVSWSGDLVVHGGGRSPNVEGLDLEKANVAYGKTGIEVDAYMQSKSNPHVYAIGDVAATPGAPLTPVGQLEANIAYKHITGEKSKKADYTGVPSVVFTTPMLASAGISADEAEKMDTDVDIHERDISDWFTYKHMNSDFAAVKIIEDKQTGKILGAHMLGDGADEMINVFAMAIQLQLTTNQLKSVTYAFPTAISDIGSMI